MWSQRKEFRCDPTSTTDAGRSPDPPLLSDNHPWLYLYAIKSFAKHFGKPPDQLGAEHIRRYQLFLTREKKVSTSTYVMMICGLRFFYTHTLHRKVAIERIPFPRRERKLPVILSRDEVKALLEAPSDLRDRAMLAILYGSGLRVSEVTRIKV